ncbi:MAG: hypothetical protein HYX27_04895 [Acidobacteria bacterium]|nr:hypothetical protein [Acidobacteriota bacterium]
MPIELFLRSARESISTLEGLELTVGLRNRTGVTLTDIPRPELDGTGAFTIGVFDRPDTDQGPLRAMNAVSQQVMLTLGRPSPSVCNGTLPDGAPWVWNLDCATLHHTLPPGRLQLQGRYELPGESEAALSPALAVTVTPEQVVSVQTVRDNPVLPGVALLIGARPSEDAPVRYFLRQHNALVPLAAWYSKPVLTDAGVENAIPAMPDYVRRQDFEPAFRKWIVWTQNGKLFAQCFRFGLPLDAPLDAPWTAPAPKAAKLHAAFSRADGSLAVVFVASNNRLLIVHWDAGGLRPLFIHQLSGAAPFAITSGDGVFYLAVPSEGIKVVQLANSGAVIAEHQVFTTAEEGVLHSIEFDWPNRRVRAIRRRQINEDQIYDFISAPIDRNDAAILSRHSKPTEPIQEIAFDCAANGRFHILAASAERLYYASNNDEPAVAATGKGPYFPQVVCGEGIYLGWAQPGIGYKFSRVNSRDPVNFLIEYDLTPEAPR